MVKRYGRAERLRRIAARVQIAIAIALTLPAEEAYRRLVRLEVRLHKMKTKMSGSDLERFFAALGTLVNNACFEAKEGLSKCPPGMLDEHADCVDLVRTHLQAAS